MRTTGPSRPVITEVNFPGNFQWAFVVDELASVVELTYIEKAQCGTTDKRPIGEPMGAVCIGPH